MPVFLIEENVLHAKLNTSKYRDYIYGRITGNCLSNLPVGFMRKKDKFKVMIFEYIHFLVKSSQKHGRKAPPYNSIYLYGNRTSMGC